MAWKSIFSFYGGKSKIVDSYPEPKHQLIIEPFAGAAAYSFRHARAGTGRTAWINELDERTRSIWEFLLAPDASGWIRLAWPATVSHGRTWRDYLPDPCPAGLVELFRAEANQGTQGARGVHESVTSMAVKCWPRTRGKFLDIIPQISHWKLTSRDYALCSNCNATWFVDPPYHNPAGARYRSGNDLDYRSLADWCRSRAGQVIVAENVGADWLPFQSLATSARGIKSRYQKANAPEAIWTNDMPVL
jgi:hypothetical protein